MLTSLTRFTKQPRLSSQFMNLSGNNKFSCYPALYADGLRFISSPCADLLAIYDKNNNKKKRQKTRHSPDKGINKIKSNQRWNSFILNLAIYPDFSVISPPFLPPCEAPLPCVPSGRSEDHYWWPDAEEQRSYWGYPPPTAALLRMRREAEANRARAVLAVGTPRGPREELAPRNPEIKTF